jgi:hypothetical protein
VRFARAVDISGAATEHLPISTGAVVMQTSSTFTWVAIGLVILVWPVLFIALWISIAYLLSAVGGWRALGRRYRTDAVPRGNRVWSALGGMVGMVRYRGVLNVTRTDDGLYLSVNRLFRVGHPTLFIPWPEIRNARRTSMFFWRYIAFDIGEPKIASMRLPPEVFDGAPVFVEG